jgi:hypothetical protein
MRTENLSKTYQKGTNGSFSVNALCTREDTDKIAVNILTDTVCRSLIGIFGVAAAAFVPCFIVSAHYRYAAGPAARRYIYSSY